MAEAKGLRVQQRSGGAITHHYLLISLLIALMLAIWAPATVRSRASAASSSAVFHATAPQTSCDGTLPRGTVIGIAAADVNGYWIANSQGRVIACGDAPDLGSVAVTLNQPIVGIEPTFTGRGYYLVAADGGVFSFGDAAFYGSTGSLRLNKPIVGMAVNFGGYWLVASDGGVFSFGFAPFVGSMGSVKLNSPIVGMALYGQGSSIGYYLVASDGGVFAFNATFLGSPVSVRLNAPIVGIVDSPSGDAGYYLVASDGGVYAYGVPFVGSTGSLQLAAPVVGMEDQTMVSGCPPPQTKEHPRTCEITYGYRLVARDAGVFDFGNADFYGSGT